MTGSIRAFVANQVNVAISRFLGLKCASNILRFDSNVPPQMCLLKCASSMCLLNVPPQCRSFIIVHGSQSDDLYWIYALLTRNQPCRDYALWEAVFGKIWWEEAQKHFIGPGLGAFLTVKRVHIMC